MERAFLITGIVANVLTILTVLAGIYFAWPLYRAMLKKMRDDAAEAIKKV